MGKRRREETPDESDADDTEWPAKEILAEQGGFYEILWEGVNPDNGESWETTWEPIENASADLVRAWQLKKAQKGIKRPPAPAHRLRLDAEPESEEGEDDAERKVKAKRRASPSKSGPKRSAKEPESPARASTKKRPRQQQGSSASPQKRKRLHESPALETDYSDVGDYTRDKSARPKPASPRKPASPKKRKDKQVAAAPRQRVIFQETNDDDEEEDQLMSDDADPLPQSQADDPRAGPSSPVQTPPSGRPSSSSSSESDSSPDGQNARSSLKKRASGGQRGGRESSSESDAFVPPDGLKQQLRRSPVQPIERVRRQKPKLDLVQSSTQSNDSSQNVIVVPSSIEPTNNAVRKGQQANDDAGDTSAKDDHGVAGRPSPPPDEGVWKSHVRVLLRMIHKTVSLRSLIPLRRDTNDDDDDGDGDDDRREVFAQPSKPVRAIMHAPGSRSFASPAKLHARRAYEEKKIAQIRAENAAANARRASSSLSAAFAAIATAGTNGSGSGGGRATQSDYETINDPDSPQRPSQPWSSNSHVH